MCAHMNVMSINGIGSQYSMTIIWQPGGDTLHKLSEQIKTIYWKWSLSLSKIIKYSESIFSNKRRGQKSFYPVDLVSWFIYEVMTLQLSTECNSLTHYRCIRQNVTVKYHSFVPNNVVRAIIELSNTIWVRLTITADLSPHLHWVIPWVQCNYFLPSACKLLENLVGSYILDQNLLETLFIAK